MYEMELKVRASHDDVRPVLADRGAEHRAAVRQVDTYYGAPHRDFAQTDEAVRIRRETSSNGDTTTVLTYKGPLVDDASKTRSEVETTVADGDATAAILEALGFDPAGTVVKDRERYGLEGYVVTLDAVEGLGEFVEVETAVAPDGTGVPGHETDAPDGDETATAAVERAREGAVDILEGLDLDPNAQIRTSYLGLLLDAGATTGEDNLE